MVYVANSEHTLHACGLCHLAHELGNGFLVVIAVASKVVGHVERNIAFQLFPFFGGLCLQLQASEQHDDSCQEGSYAATRGLKTFHTLSLLYI